MDLYVFDIMLRGRGACLINYYTQTLKLSGTRTKPILDLCQVTLKKLQFPVQRVAVIVASRAAAIFFFTFFLVWYGNISHFLKSHGRSTGLIVILLYH